MRLKKIWGRTTVRGHANWWKTWPLWNRGKQLQYKIDRSEKMPHRRATNTESMDRMLLWAVQLQGQRRSISTELSTDRHREWPPHSPQRSWGCTTIIEEKEVSWSRQHPSRTGLSRWRGCNHRSHNNLQQDLADRRMANPLDPVLSHQTSQERQPAAVSELPNNKRNQSPKQSHAEN